MIMKSSQLSYHELWCYRILSLTVLNALQNGDMSKISGKTFSFSTLRSLLPLYALLRHHATVSKARTRIRSKFLVADDLQGIRRSGLVEWYLEQIQESIDTEQELIERKTIIDKVIDRLIYKVNFNRIHFIRSQNQIE